MTDSALSPVAAGLRQHDRERFVTALFAAAARRDDLLVLYGFNAEVVRIKSLVREPLAGQIRLQWWRDVLTGDRPASETDPHPIAAPLTRLLAAGRVNRPALLAMLDAREWELQRESFASLAQMTAHADATAGNLALAALDLLGGGDPASQAAARGANIAYGLVGMVRSAPIHAAQGWTVLAPGLTVPAIAAQAQTTLAIARQNPVQRNAVPVCLLGTLAHHQLGLLRRGQDGKLGQPQTFPLRLMWAAWRGTF